MVGAAALLLSAIPGLQSDTSSFDQPESIHLALLGLATLLFTPFSRSRSSGAQKLASALLVIAVVAQTFILLAPLEQIGGLPAELLPLGLTLVAALASLPEKFRGPASSAPTADAEARPRPVARTAAAPAPARPLADDRERGTVKWFNTSKGFGFISRDTGDDIFVHFRAIRGEGHRVLMEGQRVEFSVIQRDKGLQAEDVVIAA
ncbi:cold-shock protein [Pseudomonas oryzihabitans]|uniref:Cold-shock protein n=1 Tax=Pseudomonas oryzihabitans TaxID=47885 RepID=A0A0U4XV46_9PSED|nr:cold-shock protein [Pseudomonas oryzihabitans]